MQHSPATGAAKTPDTPAARLPARPVRPLDRPSPSCAGAGCRTASALPVQHTLLSACMPVTRSARTHCPVPTTYAVLDGQSPSVALDTRLPQHRRMLRTQRLSTRRGNLVTSHVGYLWKDKWDPTNHWQVSQIKLVAPVLHHIDSGITVRMNWLQANAAAHWRLLQRSLRRWSASSWTDGAAATRLPGPSQQQTAGAAAISHDSA